MASEGILKNSDSIMTGSLEILKIEMKLLVTKKRSLLQLSYNMEENHDGKKLMLQEECLDSMNRDWWNKYILDIPVVRSSWWTPSRNKKVENPKSSKETNHLL